MITCAPARRIATSDSSVAARRSSAPCWAANRMAACSPDTWYAAIGRFVDLGQPRDHVEVVPGRLHHQQVGALRLVQQRLAQRLAGVGRIHLVAPAVAFLRTRVGGVAERAVEGGGELGRVAHDRGRLGEALVVERAADGPHAAVHHVAGRDQVGAGPGVRDGDAAEQRQRRVVGDRAVVVEHAAVAVVGVLAEADIGRDHEARRGGPDGARRDLHGAVRIPRGRALGVLRRGQAEQDHAADAGGGGALRLGRRQVGRQVRDAREGGDRLPATLAGNDEHGEDQMLRFETGLAHEIAQTLRPPESAGPDGMRHTRILTGAR